MYCNLLSNKPQYPKCSQPVKEPPALQTQEQSALPIPLVGKSFNTRNSWNQFNWEASPKSNNSVHDTIFHRSWIQQTFPSWVHILTEDTRIFTVKPPPQTLVMEIWPPAFFPNFESNISDKKTHHKIDISYEIIFPSVWPKSNLPSPTEIRPSQPVIESVMVCLEVGRNPMTSPLALAGRLKIMAWWSTSTQEFEFYTWQIHKNRKYQTNLIDSQVQ